MHGPDIVDFGYFAVTYDGVYFQVLMGVEDELVEVATYPEYSLAYNLQHNYAECCD